jgi:hypothetical protein
MMRLPLSWSTEDKLRRADETMEFILGLAHSLTSETRSSAISGGQRKGVNIGIEMKWSLILHCCASTNQLRAPRRHSALKWVPEWLAISSVWLRRGRDGHLSCRELLQILGKVGQRHVRTSTSQFNFSKNDLVPPTVKCLESGVSSAPAH